MLTLVAVASLMTPATGASWAGPLFYEEVSEEVGLTHEGPSWGMAVGDINNDQLPDLYVNHHTARPRFWINDSQEPGNFFEWEPQFVGRETFDDGDHHSPTFIDVDGDGCVELYDSEGSSRGRRPLPNWLLSFKCGRKTRNLTESSGLRDDMGRGRGAIWADFDLDGVPDVLQINLLQPDYPGHLYFGRGDGTFEDQGSGTGLPLDQDMEGGVARDLNGDLYPDLVLTGRRTAVYRNRGDGTFEDVSAQAGISIQGDFPRILVEDFNHDGIPDVLVVDRQGRYDGVGQPDSLTIRYDLAATDLIPRSLAFQCGGDTVEVMAFMRGGPARIYNKGVTYFGPQMLNPPYLPITYPSPQFPIPASLESIVDGVPEWSTGPAGTFIWREPDTHRWELRVHGSGDWSTHNTPGRPQKSRGWFKSNQPITDVSVPNIWQPDTTVTRYIFLGNGDFTFRDASEGSGLQDHWGEVWDAVSGDLNNDGHLDLFIVNGSQVVDQRNDLYLGDGTGCFVQSSVESGIPEGRSGSSDVAVLLDSDRNGSLEILVSQGGGNDPFQGPLDLLRPIEVPGNWLQLDLRQVPGGPSALGARVELVTGGVHQIRWWDQGQSHRSQDEATLHFGLGSAAVVDTLTVFWPDGSARSETGISANQRLRVEVDW